MELTNYDHLNKFASIASDFKTCDELNLTSFLEKLFPGSTEGRKNEFMQNILNPLIQSIKNPDRIILGAITFQIYVQSANFATIFPELESKYNFTHKDSEMSLKKAGLVKGKHYDYASIEINNLTCGENVSNAHKFFNEDTRNEKFVLMSFNGLKKLLNYMHERASAIVNHYLYDGAGKPMSNTYNRWLDFEKVYKRTKEVHTENRKKYLDELDKINKEVEFYNLFEDEKVPFAVKLCEEKCKQTGGSVNGMIINRTGQRSKFIISKDIEDKLESVLSELGEFTISYFDQFTGQEDDSDIIVIQSIDKTSMASAMKLYK